MTRVVRSIAFCLLALTTGCGKLALVDRGPVPISTGDTVMPVRPGDVIIISTWTLAIGGANSDTAPSMQSSRLPIRHIPRYGGAAVALTPDEAAFLGTVLATRRKAYFPDSATAAAVAAEVEAKQIDLWNALVDSLVFAKEGATTSYGQIKVRGTSCDLTNQCTTSPLCVEIAKLPTLKDNLNGFCRGVERSEVRDLPPYSTKLEPITDLNGPNDSGFYQLARVIGASGQFERGGVMLARLNDAEGRWSLAAWEGSGICADRDGEWKIARIVIRTPSGSRRVRIVANNDRPEYRVKLASDARASNEDRASHRRTEREKKGRRGTLDRQSLDYLFPGDITWIEWRSGDKRRPLGPDAVARAMCTIAPVDR
jgi:hypothetical protein